MTSGKAQNSLEEIGKEIKSIQQAGIPFNIPLGMPIFNPFAGKRMHFKMQYRMPGVKLEDAVQGVMFADYNSFMDIKKETYSRKSRTRYIKFNPFTRELEKEGRRFGEIGAVSGRTVAAMMVAALGLIEWELSEEASPSGDVATINIKVTNRLFSGHFKIRIRRRPDGVIMEDDWCPDGGADMRTDYLAMANLVLTTHPKGFEQLAERVIEEIARANARGHSFVGEIGPPSVEI